MCLFLFFNFYQYEKFDPQKRTMLALMWLANNLKCNMAYFVPELLISLYSIVIHVRFLFTTKQNPKKNRPLNQAAIYQSRA